MTRARTTLIGAALGTTVLLFCAVSAALVHWYEEGRAIAVCDAAKDFFEHNERAPHSLGELPPSIETSARDGQPFGWRCGDGDAPECSVTWTGVDGAEVGRSCGRLDERSWIDWM